MRMRGRALQCTLPEPYDESEPHRSRGGLFPEHAPATVNLTGTTVFNIANPVLNQASLTFDATTLGVGQAVTVHGDTAQGSPGTLTATSVFLMTRSIVGNFSALLAAGSDDFTGGFKCFPRATLESIDFADVKSHGFASLYEINYILHRSGKRFQEVPIIFVERRAGQSKLSFKMVLEGLGVMLRLRLSGGR